MSTPLRPRVLLLSGVLLLAGSCATPGAAGGGDMDALLARVEAQLDQAVPEMTECFQRELGARAQTLNGRITVRFEIGEDGLVSQLAVLASELGAPEAESCVTVTLSRQYFADWEGHRPVRLTKPFHFVAGQ